MGVSEWKTAGREKQKRLHFAVTVSPQLQTVFAQLFSICFPYDLGAWNRLHYLIKRLNATCRSSSEQSAQTVSFIIPLWWWNHIFVLLIETYVTLAKPCGHFPGPYLTEALCRYYSTTRLTATSVMSVTSLYSHYFSAPRNGHTFPYKKKTNVNTANGHILTSQTSCNFTPLIRPLVRNLEN